MVFGTLGICSFQKFGTLSFFLWIQIIADGHRENRSTTMYLSASFKNLTGPQKSNCRHSFGSLISHIFPISPMPHIGLRFLPAAVHSLLPSAAATKLRWRLGNHASLAASNMLPRQWWRLWIQLNNAVSRGIGTTRSSYIQKQFSFTWKSFVWWPRTQICTHCFEIPVQIRVFSFYHFLDRLQSWVFRLTSFVRASTGGMTDINTLAG